MNSPSVRCRDECPPQLPKRSRRGPPPSSLFAGSRRKRHREDATLPRLARRTNGTSISHDVVSGEQKPESRPFLSPRSRTAHHRLEIEEPRKVLLTDPDTGIVNLERHRLVSVVADH